MTNVPEANGAEAGNRPPGAPAAKPTEGKLARTDIYLEKETGKVLNRFVMLVIASTAELAIGHWYKKKRKENEQLRKHNRRPW